MPFTPFRRSVFWNRGCPREHTILHEHESIRSSPGPLNVLQKKKCAKKRDIWDSSKNYKLLKIERTIFKYF